MPLHIVQRGHNRKEIFARDSDYRHYLDNLLEAKSRLATQVLAYCLMTNHVHLVLMPGDDAAAISDLMGTLAARQARRINRREKRSGTLWESRFKSSLIDTDRYLLACCRYIDLNPVRAALTATPEDYPWSGFCGRSELSFDPILDHHPVFEALGATAEQQALAYRRFVAQGVGDDECTLIRSALQRNQLTGNSRFVAEIQARIGRRLSMKARGRPRQTGKK